MIGLLGYRFLNSDSKYLAPLAYDINSKDHEIFKDFDSFSQVQSKQQTRLATVQNGTSSLRLQFKAHDL